MGNDVIIRKPLLSAAFASRLVNSVEVKEITFKPGQKTGLQQASVSSLELHRRRHRTDPARRRRAKDIHRRIGRIRACGHRDAALRQSVRHRAAKVYCLLSAAWSAGVDRNVARARFPIAGIEFFWRVDANDASGSCPESANGTNC